jgi:hypothetical protein
VAEHPLNLHDLLLHLLAAGLWTESLVGKYDENVAVPDRLSPELCQATTGK